MKKSSVITTGELSGDRDVVPLPACHPGEKTEKPEATYGSPFKSQNVEPDPITDHYYKKRTRSLEFQEQPKIVIVDTAFPGLTEKTET